MIQIIHGTKPEDNKLEIKVLENVTRINSTFGSLDFLPIKLIFQQLSTEEYSYFLTNADLALFISERDSLNIAVYEYIFAQQNSHQSPLIISEFSGIAGTLSTAFLVNPWDSHGIALVIHEAIQLSEAEKFMRHSILFNVVSNLSIDQWKKSFLQELEDISAKQSVHLKSDTLSSCIVKPFYENSVKRLFLLDYDVIF